MIRSLLLALLVLGAGPASALDIDDLAWLAGHWTTKEGESTVEEQWLAPAAGVMLGVGRTVHGDALELMEFLVIEQRGDAVVYRPYPNIQRTVSFLAVAADANRAVFVNPDHDFPQRIEYRLEDADRLQVTLTGDGDPVTYTLERR